MKTTSPVALAFALAFAAAGWTPLAFAGAKDRTLDIYWVDSEGGGSTLIVTPNDEAVLIDTGHPGGRDAPRIAAAAKAAGLAKIDRLIVTHFHSDHFGAAHEITQLIPIVCVHERAIPDRDPDGRAASTWPVQSKPYRELAVQRRERLAPGVVIALKPVEGGPQLELRCLAADQKFVEPTEAQKRQTNPLAGTVPAKPADTSDNANSAVFVLQFGAFRFFAGGDLTWNLEEQLVAPHNRVGVVDVYQTNHHGLDQSNNPVLVKSLEPTVVVMNNGPYKGGQAGTFAAVRSAASVQAFYQLHKSFNAPEQNGDGEYIANFANVRPADAHKCTANLIKLSVAPDGKSYTISIPASGHSRTFATKGVER